MKNEKVSHVIEVNWKMTCHVRQVLIIIQFIKSGGLFVILARGNWGRLTSVKLEANKLVAIAISWLICVYVSSI